jgi:hypothetical protein
VAFTPDTITFPVDGDAVTPFDPVTEETAPDDPATVKN